MASIKEIAKICGVSPATVSYVLSGKNKMTPSVEQRIRSVAKSLNYHVNNTARALRTGKNQVIGLILPSISNPFFSELTEELILKAGEANYSIIIYDLKVQNNDINDAVNCLVGRGVDSLIIVPGVHLQEKFPSCFNLPFVVIDQECNVLDSVCVDNAMGGCLQAEYAYAMGHKDIIYISGPLSEPCSKQRENGFLLRSQSLGLNIVCTQSCEFSLDLNHGVRTILHQYAGQYSLVCTGNDLIAFGVIKEIQMIMNKRIPNDVSIIGFDDNMFADIVSPPLTTINQSVKEISGHAIDLLIEKMECPDTETRHILVRPFLVERESVAKIR